MTALYALASILSAFLVFLIQPVAAKIALPTLGGTPAVWSGCMLFFQAVLLMGYGYAHLLTGRVPLRVQPFIHLALLAIVVLFFPLAFNGLEDADAVHAPLTWLLFLLLTSVGLPYFVISATSPLLQRWFSHSGHKDAANPYFLYAASNIGSMGALLLYPFAIEPLATLAGQVRLWEAGITLLAVCFVGVAFTLLRRGKAALQAEDTVVAETVGDAPDWRKRLIWVALAFVPSSLLYGVTTYITTDIASVPLLWILPLALYLATFIMVFARRPRGIDLALRVAPFAAVTMLFLIASNLHNITIGFIVHIVGFFFVTLAMHGILARRKPNARYLTEFFLWMSFGGVLGGIFNTLIAPFIFNNILEYIFALTAAAVLQFYLTDSYQDWLRRDKPLLKNFADVFRFMFILISLMAILQYGGFNETGNILLEKRSVFGVNRVTAFEEARVHVFKHGTTVHGFQSLDEEKRLNPTSYYVDLERLFEAQQSMPVAVIGLGTGTLACYGGEGQKIDFYEIDPLVAEIASNPEYFTYMRDCRTEKQVILGDGRQRMKEQPDGKYGLILIDAFSSDAIPGHLMTKEALEIYMQKLAPEGIIAFHISNRHIDLRPVLLALTQDAGLKMRVRTKHANKKEAGAMNSTWAVIARDDMVLDKVSGGAEEWKILKEDEESARYLWRDDFSNILFTLVPVRKWLGLESKE